MGGIGMAEDTVSVPKSTSRSPLVLVNPFWSHPQQVFLPTAARPSYNQRKSQLFFPDTSRALPGDWIFISPNGQTKFRVGKIGISNQHLVLSTTDKTDIAFPWEKVTSINVSPNGIIEIKSTALKLGTIGTSQLRPVLVTVDAKYFQELESFITFLRKCKNFFDPLEIFD